MKFLLPVLLLTSICAYSADIDSIAVRFAGESPSLAAEKARLDAEYQEALNENILEGPEAEFEYKFGREENRWGAGIGQGFDWPGVYAARRTANGIRKSALGRLYESRLADKALDIKLAILRHRRAAELHAAYSDIKKHFELLKDTYARSLARGETTILDVRRVEVEFFKASVEVGEAETALKSAEANLIGLGGKDLAEASGSYRYTLAALRPMQVYQDAMVEANPEMAYYNSLSHLAEAEMKVARRSLLPSFKLSFIHDYEEGSHFNGFGIGISLPSWNGKHRIAAARSAAVAATSALTDYKMQMSAQLYADYARAGELYSTLSASTATFEDGDYTRLLQKALDAGKINLYQYLSDYLEYTGAKVTYINLLYDYAETDARLSRYSILDK